MVQITWLGHATFKLELGSGEVLILDPWVEGNPAYPQGYKIERVDGILISHGHFDHIHDAIPLAKKFKPKVVAIFETAKWLESKGVENTSGMNKGGSQMVGPVKATMVHAIHSCGILDGDQIIYGGKPAAMSAFAGNRCRLFRRRYQRIYRHGTDSRTLPAGAGISADRRPLYHEPARGFHGGETAERKKIIPMHFGTFPALTGTPEQLADLLKQSMPDTEVWKLEPGNTVKW